MTLAGYVRAGLPSSEPPRPGQKSYEQLRDCYHPAIDPAFVATDIVEVWARDAPNDLDVVTIDADGELVETKTIKELVDKSIAVASGLKARGLCKGDRVLIMLPRISAWYAGMLGTIRIGAIPMPGPNLLTPKDIGFRISRGRAVAVITDRTTVVQVALTRPEPALILSIIARHQINSFCAPPTLNRQVILADFAPFDLTSLRHCTSAGEPLNPEVIRVWREKTGLTIYDGYGQTESTVLVANFPFLTIRPGSMGKPVPGYGVDIRDEDGNPLPDHVSGAIAVRRDPHPLGLFRGYFEDPEATRERFKGGWYFTGDRGQRDADGYIWFKGRDDDVITSSAYRIGPFEVAFALIEHPAVAEAGVVGRPNAQRTEIVCAFAILNPGFEPSPIN